MYALMALAVLVKGPIGVLLPGATIGLFVLLQMPSPSAVEASWSRRAARRVWVMVAAFPATFWRMRPLTALAAVLLIAGPWFVAVGLQTDGQFLREFFGVHNFGRFLKPMENHRGPIIYYLPVIAIGFFPWSIFAIPTAIHSATTEQDRAKYRFLLCWAGWMVGFFSLASTKLPNYVLPAYPALALLTAAWLTAWIAGRERLSRWWPRLAFGTLASIGLLLVLCLSLVRFVTISGEPLLERLGVNGTLTLDLSRQYWTGLVPLTGGALSLLLLRAGRRHECLVAAGATSMAFTFSILVVAASALNSHQTSAPLASAMHSARSTAPKVASFRHSPPSLIFYASQRVERLKTAADAARFLKGSTDAQLVTTDIGLEQLQAVSSEPVRILERRPRFPRSGEVLLISADGLPAETVRQAAAEMPID
jgi:4-amino-4-deoxy-L-arabinose transferase-like glycosyltransferase